MKEDCMNHCRGPPNKETTLISEIKAIKHIRKCSVQATKDKVISEEVNADLLVKAKSDSKLISGGGQT